MQRQREFRPVQRIGTEAHVGIALVFHAEVKRAVAIEKPPLLIFQDIGVRRVFRLQGPVVVDLVFDPGEGRGFAPEPLVRVGGARRVHWRTAAEGRADAAARSQSAPAQTCGHLDLFAKGLGGRHIFGSIEPLPGQILQPDSQCGGNLAFLQHLIAQVDAAVAFLAIPRGHGIPVAPGLKAERPRQAFRELEAQGGPGDRTDQRGRKRKGCVFLGVARRHVDQTCRAIQVQCAGYFGQGGYADQGSAKCKRGKKTGGSLHDHRILDVAPIYAKITRSGQGRTSRRLGETGWYGISVNRRGVSPLPA